VSARIQTDVELEKDALIHNALVGTCRLVLWENRSADGRITYPLGKDAEGLIMYGDDGYMFVAIMPARRRRSTPEIFSVGALRKRRRRLNIRLLLRAVRLRRR
jgi:hypothetical protein